MSESCTYISSSVEEFDRDSWNQLVSDGYNNSIDNISRWINYEMAIKDIADYLIMIEESPSYCFIIDSDGNQLVIHGGLITSGSSCSKSSDISIFRDYLEQVYYDNKLNMEDFDKLDRKLVDPFISIIEGASVERSCNMLSNSVNELQIDDKAVDYLIDNWRKLTRFFTNKNLIKLSMK